MSTSPGSLQSPDELFSDFLVRARRAAAYQWCLRSILRGLIGGLFVSAVLIFGRKYVELPSAIVASVCIGFAVFGGNLVFTRRDVFRVSEALDSATGAEGRIVGASEFVAEAASDPFKRLAVAEAGAWLAGRIDTIRLWNWPWEGYLVPVLVIILVGAYSWIF